MSQPPSRSGPRGLWRWTHTVLHRPLSLSPTAIARLGRVFLLALALGLITSHRSLATLAWWGAVAAVAVVASLPLPRAAGRAVRIIEGVTTAAAIIDTSGVVTGTVTSPFFPYLVAPALAAGLARGVDGAIIIPGLEAAALVAGMVVEAHVRASSDFIVNSAEWIVFALASGLAGALIRRLLSAGEEPPTAETSYVAAYRLLSQLRPVARELSVGLDPSTIAQSLLSDLADEIGFALGAVFTRAGGDRLTPLAHLGSERVPEWSVEITDDETPFAEAWLSQRPVLIGRRFERGRAGTAVVFPLVIGLRSFGLVALESPAQAAFGPEEVRRGAELIAPAALRLETALLFDEVRGLATVEERRRLAREIHDGIAQELSSLGYLVDSLTMDARDRKATTVAEGLVGLRGEMTRIISELRLSIFDLRSEVDTHGGLGAALSEYVRSVGRNSQFTVHLSLRESTTRLAADAEAELLRIAQEAITNARKHAGAQNLWVTLEVDAPRALLRIEDDGRGIRGKRVDSYGMEIMRERAQRLRGALRVSPRETGGTAVEVRIGTEDRATLTGAEAGGVGG